MSLENAPVLSPITDETYLTTQPWNRWLANLVNEVNVLNAGASNTANYLFGNISVNSSLSSWQAASSGNFIIQSGLAGIGAIYNCPVLTYNVYFDASSYRYISAGPLTAALYVISTGYHSWYSFPAGTAGNVASALLSMQLDVNGNASIAGTVTTLGGATFHTTSSALTNGSGASIGTLATAPSAGNPTKWIGINDNGTTRYIPAW